MEEKFYFQMNAINQLKQECDYLSGLLRFQEEETFKLENSNDANKKIIDAQKGVINDLSRQLRGKIGDLEQLNGHLDNYKEANNGLVDKAQKLDSHQTRIQKMEAYQKELMKKITDRDSNIEYLDKTVAELKQKIQDKSSFESKEKHHLQKELLNMQTMYDDLDDKYKNLLLIQAQTKLQQTVPSLGARQATIQIAYQRRQVKLEQKQQDLSTDSQFMKQLEYAPKKLRVVKVADVQILGLELNMRFRQKRMTISDVIEQYLFDDLNKKQGFVSIKEIHTRLKIEPFLLFDQDKSMLLARYMIEDNSQEFTDFNVDLTESLIIVKSIFTNLIGTYKIISSDEEANLKEQIVQLYQIIVKYKNSLKQHFDQIPSVKGEITKKQLLDTFIYMDIDLKKDQIDYFLLRLFALSNNVNKFPYAKIFEIFQPQLIKEEKPQAQQKKKKKERQSENLRAGVFDTKQFFNYQKSNLVQEVNQDQEQ